MVWIQLFIASTVAALFMSFGMIGMGVYEIIVDQQKHQNKEGFIVTHIFITFLIFDSANILILLSVAYITLYVIRGFSYKWHISLHYFLYVLLEIISSVCIMCKYDYLSNSLALQIMCGVLSVLLFFFNFLAVKIFNDIEREKRIRRETRMQAVYRKQEGGCVHISLGRPGFFDTSTAASEYFWSWFNT